MLTIKAIHHAMSPVIRGDSFQYLHRMSVLFVVSYCPDLFYAGTEIITLKLHSHENTTCVQVHITDATQHILHGNLFPFASLFSEHLHPSSFPLNA